MAHRSDGTSHSCRHTIAEATSGERHFTFWDYPRCQIRHYAKALEGHNTSGHEVSCREECVLEIGHGGLTVGNDGSKVVILDVQNYVKEQQDVKAHEVKHCSKKVNGQISHDPL